MIAERPSVRLAIGAIAALAAALIAYPLLRVVQRLLFPEADPGLVLWSDHAGYFWRAWIASYIGGMAGIAAYVAATRDAGATLRVVVALVAAGALSITAQGVLVP